MNGRLEIQKARRNARQQRARAALYARGLTVRGTPLKYPERRGSTGKECYGRAGLPAELVARMYADYKRLNSLAQAGHLWDRTRQSMYIIFTNHGLPLNAKRFQAKIHYGGRAYTPGKNGYFRDTIYRHGRRFDGEAQLHRRMWADAHGPIPPDHEVGFRDHNPANVKLDNLFCLHRLAMREHNWTGANGSTKSARRRLALLLQGRGRFTAGLRKAA